MSGERQTQKYQQALRLANDLEQAQTIGYKITFDELAEMEPRELYRHLQDEWWREYNGLMQEWQPTQDEVYP